MSPKSLELQAKTLSNKRQREEDLQNSIQELLWTVQHVFPFPLS